MRELTNRQREVLGFMRSFQTKYGVPPTVRELGDRFKITPRAAFDHLRALERKGELQRRPSVGRTSRALTLPDAVGGRMHHSVPILGRIAAGTPLLAQENREGEVPIAWVARLLCARIRSAPGESAPRSRDRARRDRARRRHRLGRRLFAGGGLTVAGVTRSQILPSTNRSSRAPSRWPARRSSFRMSSAS